MHGGQPSLEAQLVNLADELAYNAHDVDDGVRSGLVTLEQLQEVPLLAHWQTEVRQQHPLVGGRRLLHETLRRMLSALVHDLSAATQAAVLQAWQSSPPAKDTNPRISADWVRSSPALATLSPAVRQQCTELKRFLFRELYRHPQVTRMTERARTVVTDLFASYLERPDEMSSDFAASHDRPRAVADYIAGMTDRFALREHQRLTGQRLFDDERLPAEPAR